MPNQLTENDLKTFAAKHPPRQATFSADDAIAAISTERPARPAVKTAEDFASLVTQPAAGGIAR